MVSASASGAPSSVPAALSMGDKYAALSDLDSIFKAHAPTPNVGQGSMFSSSNSSNTSIGISSGTPSGMSSSVSTGMSAGMSSGPNPFASGSTLTSQSQSNPFQSSGGGMNQLNGFLGGNTGFGSNPSVPSSAQSLNFASAGMTAMAANQFSKLGGNQPGLFGSQGGTAVMQSSGFSTGQGQFGTGVPAQSTGGQFGGAQFGSSQFGGAQFASAQLGGGFLQQQHQQQQTFGGMVAGLPSANQFGQTTQQQQFSGGWQQESQSNPFMVRYMGDQV